MNGRGKRNKGANGERELAGILSDELGFVVKRKLGQARDGGHDIEVGHFLIEVKRQERLAIEEWCRQIECACTTYSQINETGALEPPVPVVVFRRNAQPWRAVVPLDFLIKAMREDLSAKQGIRPRQADGHIDHGEEVLHQLPDESAS